MLTHDSQDANSGFELRKCYSCFRPVEFCHCEIIPDVKNKTRILILQHRRERFHPFNTARMANAALENSELIVDHVHKLAEHKFPFDSKTGLLYPGKNAVPITELEPQDRPTQMVVIDGTWHHAKMLMRDLPQLAELKQYRINPQTPGNYRIRKEPTLDSLSTIEAIVAALRELEPELQGTEKMLAAFDQMIDTQLAHPKAPDATRVNKKRYGTPFNIPIRLIREFENAVVAYGESQRIRRGDAVVQMPIYWVAHRLSTGEMFRETLACQKPLTDVNLEHLKLSRHDFETTLSYDQFRDRWQQFLRPEDFMVTYKQSTVELLKRIQANCSPSLVLKSVDLGQGRNGSLESVIEREKIDVRQLPFDGRAGRRLSEISALAEYFWKVGKREILPHSPNTD